MAFGRLERNPGARPMSEINMTPLIDVMLVLLVIFMLTAPLMASSLRLELPKVEAKGGSDAAAVLEVALDEGGQAFLGSEPATVEEIGARARGVAQRQPQTEVQLRADARVPYGRVAELIGVLQQAGLARIGFVTESPAAAAAPATAASR